MTASRLKMATLATALGALATSGAALAGDPTPAFGAFVAVCGDTGADFAAVKAGADAHGWGSTDTPTDASMPGVTVSNQLSRATTADRTGLVLSAWNGVTKSGVKVSDCTVHVAATNFDALRQNASSWTSFAPVESTPKKVVFRFTNDTKGRRALTSAEYDAAANGAGLQILTVSGDANGAVLDLMMIKK